MPQREQFVPIPREVEEKLWSVRHRMRLLAGLRGLTITVTLFLFAMIACMVIDRLVVLFNSGWRVLLTFLSLGLGCIGMILWCLRPLLARRRLPTVAQEVDRAVPSLKERWTTVTGLSETKDPPEIRGAERLIQKVAREAADMSPLVAARNVVPRGRVRRCGIWLAVAVGVLGLLFALKFEETSVLLKRFWAPRSDITLTRVVALTGSRCVPRHEPATIEARMEGRPRQSAKLFMRNESGEQTSVTLTPSPDQGLLSFTLPSVKDSFQYRIRAGDGQSPWHTIEAIDRPDIAQVQFCVTPPPYTKRPAERKDALPGRYRAVEGSLLQIDLRATKPLGVMELHFAEDRSEALGASAEQWYRYKTTLSENIAFSVEMTDEHGLKNLKPPRCRILVYPDRAPTVEIVSPEENIVVPPDEAIPIEFRGSDDFGIETAELLVQVDSGEGDDKSLAIAIPLKDQSDPRNVRGKVLLDLAKLKLKHGSQVSYTVRVTDTRSAEGTGSGSLQPSKRGAGSEGELGTRDEDKRAYETELDGKPEREEQITSPQPDGRDAEPSQEHQRALTADGTPSNQDQQAGTPTPSLDIPPNEMTKRALPRGATASSQQQYIQVDEWAGTFEGQRRKKLQIAIEKYIKELDAFLEAAGKRVEELRKHVRVERGWGDGQGRKLGEASGNLREAVNTIDKLKDKSRGTPYAFIALQLEDIGQSHVNPAQENLTNAGALGDRTDRQLKELGSAGYHIDQARAKLAALTKQYELAKKTQELTELMQRVAKMHQIFIEDMFALLSSPPPTLNPRTGEILEVDEEYAKKLKENMEKFKELLAELAKILSEDPELLRRFMAMQRLSARTLRDQLTLLHMRQNEQHQQVAEWINAGDDGRAAVQAALAAKQAAEQLAVAEAAAKMNDNMITWVPRGIDASEGALGKSLRLSSDVASTARDVSREASAKKIDRALQLAEKLVAKLEELDEQLSEAELLEPDNPKLIAYLANRMLEAGDLIDQQTGWGKKVTAVREGRYAPAGRVDQRRLTGDTAVLAGKLGGVEAALGALSDEIADKAAQLVDILDLEIRDQQIAAIAAFEENNLPDARTAQVNAVDSFAKAEKVFDELLTLVEQIPASAPTDPGPPPTLEQLLAMLENEMKAAEKLGAAGNRLNVMMITDWITGGAGSGAGQGSGAGRARAEAKAGSAYSELAARNARRPGRKGGDGQSGELEEVGPVSGDDLRKWNVLISKLQKELMQERATVPPEQYRKAIEDYFRAISKWVSEESPEESQKP